MWIWMSVCECKCVCVCWFNSLCHIQKEKSHMFESWTGRRSIYLSVTYNTHFPNSHIGFWTSFFLLLCMCLSLSFSFFVKSPYTSHMRRALRKYKHTQFFFPFSLSLFFWCATHFFYDVRTFSECLRFTVQFLYNNESKQNKNAMFACSLHIPLTWK